MRLEQLITVDAIKQFLDGTQEVAFTVATDKPDRYRWGQKTLVKHRYLQLGKTGRVLIKPARCNGFKRSCMEADMATCIANVAFVQLARQVITAAQTDARRAGKVTGKLDKQGTEVFVQHR